MSGFVSFLKKAGQDILKVLAIGSEAAIVAAPAVAAYNPAMGTLLSSSGQIILGAEIAGASAVAAAPGTDTSAQKAALAVQAITPLAAEFTQKVGLPPATPDQVLKFNDALVAALNVFGVFQQSAQPAAAAPTQAAPAA